MKLKNITQNSVLANEVVFAHSFFSRAIGLLGKSTWPQEKALWLKPGNSIHTWFMRFPIDAVFVDKNLKVTRVRRNLKPGCLTWPDWKAKSVFEFTGQHPALTNLQPGDQLHVGD
ncbi:MAG: DUF192 domain-containing protein [Bdellovibrionales bacterium]|nr:DUF192 domain-containing protein [Bdellovibrionales bacterium]